MSMIMISDENHGMTFFGGKNGIDFICFDNKGHILCSGPKDAMIKYAKEHNVACAILIPVVFSNTLKG
jgi:hypothetical protein